MSNIHFSKTFHSVVFVEKKNPSKKETEQLTKIRETNPKFWHFTEIKTFFLREAKLPGEEEA